MSSPVDSQVLNAQMSGQELTRRKMEMDALRQRLSDPNARDKKLREAVEGFEAIFVQKLWQQMRATVPKEGYLHSKDEEFWQGMFDQELSKKMTSAGGIGLSDMLYEQLKSKLGDASRTTAPSRVATPLPLKEPRNPRADVPQPPQADEDPLYTPMEQQQAYNASEEPDVAGEQVRHAPPPPLSEDDRDALTQVEELARRLVRQDRERASQAQAAGGTGGVDTTQEGGPEPSMMEPIAAPVSMTTRNPEMGMLNWPLPGRITSDFGWRNDPFTGNREWHAGVDIGGDVGDPIGAAWDGEVVYAGEREGYGNLVVLEHEGGWRTYYAHTSRITVTPGETVSAGRKIAEVGNTGRSTGPHLHFEIRQGELAWNPEQVRNRLLAGLTVGRRS